MCASKSRIIGRLACIIVVVLVSHLAAQAQTPDNAALLYYQAFLEYEGPQFGAEATTINAFWGGLTDSNEVITSYLERNRDVIDLLKRADKIDRCDWGYDYPRLGTNLPAYLAQIRRMAFFLWADAIRRIELGDFQTAWDHAVTTNKMALHCYDGTLDSYLDALNANNISFRIIHQALPLAPRDANDLAQLGGDLPRMIASAPLLAQCIRNDFEINVNRLSRNEVQAVVRQQLESDLYTDDLDHMTEELSRAEGEDLPIIREIVTKLWNADEAMKRLLQADETFFRQNQDNRIRAADRLASVIESNLPYAQTCTALDALSQQLVEEMLNDPNASLSACDGELGPMMRRYYNLTIRSEARFNVVLAALEVYKVLAQTGQLPETLPPGSPPDPFSGLPFDYVQTADGFALSYLPEPEDPTAKIEEYEFKIDQ